MQPSTKPTQRPSLWGRLWKWLFNGGGDPTKAKQGKEQGDKPEEQTNETNLEKEIREDRAKFDRLIEEFEEFKSQTSLDVEAGKLTDAINKFQTYESMQFEIRGYNDGIKGVKDKQIASSAHARAAFIYEHTYSILSGRIKGLNSELDFNNKLVSEKQEEFEEERNFNKEINLLNKKEHRHFSGFLAAFYIVTGMLLMFADFPISLNIAKYFIDLPVNFPDTFPAKIKHPEILLFSLGITFLSVFFKIMYDDYLLQSIIPARYGTPTADSAWTGGKIARLFFKLLILAILLALLFNIGSLRNAVNELSIQPRYPALVTEKSVFNFKLFSFVGTTILLPLLSGICLSLGFGIRSNINNLKGSQKRLATLGNEKEALELKKTGFEILKNMLESLKAEWETRNKEQKLKDIQQLFMNAYNQSYRKGHRTKFGYDLYENANALFIDSIHIK